MTKTKVMTQDLLTRVDAYKQEALRVQDEYSSKLPLAKATAALDAKLNELTQDIKDPRANAQNKYAIVSQVSQSDAKLDSGLRKHMAAQLKSLSKVAFANKVKPRAVEGAARAGLSDGLDEPMVLEPATGHWVTLSDLRKRIDDNTQFSFDGERLTAAEIVERCDADSNEMRS